MTSRTALLIAFQFPPLTGISAIQRTLRLAQYLPKYGWTPIVLTATPGAYERTSAAAEREVASIEVHRAHAFDAARHLSLFGRYPQSLALPDRWSSWRWRAVPTALRLIRSRGVDVLWSTFPIATAHTIGLAVAQRSGLPWVAEFRDPMWQGDEYPTDPRVNRAWRRLESRIFTRAQRVIVTTPSAARDYLHRFPAFGERNLRVVENGYDEGTFAAAEARLRQRKASPHPAGRRLTLLHSGVIYPNERDPTQLFDAVASLKAAGDPAAARLDLLLRSPGDDARYRRMIDERQISDIVRLAPAIDYDTALEEMLVVDGLLILQAANCNAQVPAKLYEYLRAGRPIVALTDPAGDTAATLTRAGGGLIAPLDSVEHIRQVLRQFVHQADALPHRRAIRDTVADYSREHQTGEVAAVFDSLLS